MSMCEHKLNEMLSRKPTLTMSLDRSLPHPMINKFCLISYHQQGENYDLI